jgi:hypothetical protein
LSRRDINLGGSIDMQRLAQFDHYVVREIDKRVNRSLSILFKHCQHPRRETIQHGSVNMQETDIVRRAGFRMRDLRRKVSKWDLSYGRGEGGTNLTCNAEDGKAVGAILEYDNDSSLFGPYVLLIHLLLLKSVIPLRKASVVQHSRLLTVPSVLGHLVGTARGLGCSL